MNKLFFAFLLWVVPFCLQAQKVTSASGGNWVDNTSWLLGVPASGPTDASSMTTGASLTVRNVDNLTGGSIDAGNNNTLTVNGDVSNTGTLDIGDSSNPANVTAGVSMAIVANDGIITIWGNLIVNNSLAVTIQGPNGAIIIKGNIIMADGASLVVNGTLQVDGNFTGGMNTDVLVGAGGAIAVGGELTVGPGSFVHLSCTTGTPPTGTGCGTFHAHSCAPDPDSQAFCSTAGLPVELLFFSAVPGINSVNLNWSTASELNVDYFTVEKSQDAKIFTSLANVSGHGTSSIKNDYAIEDEKPTLGTTYYRLTEVDMDKSVRPLKIIRVDFTGAKSLSIFPNPATGGHLTFELNFVPEGEVVVSIVDLRGVTLSEFSINQPSITLPLQLTSGVYVVMLRSNDFRSVSRLLVK
jgi:hypothetical protein